MDPQFAQGLVVVVLAAVIVKIAMAVGTNVFWWWLAGRIYGHHRY